MRHSEIPLMQLLFCVGGLGIGIKHDALELVDGIIVGVSSSRIIFKSKKKKKFENADFLSFVILRSNQQTKGERSRECNSGDGSKQDGDSAVLIKWPYLTFS